MEGFTDLRPEIPLKTTYVWKLSSFIAGNNVSYYMLVCKNWRTHLYLSSTHNLKHNPIMIILDKYKTYHKFNQYPNKSHLGNRDKYLSFIIHLSSLYVAHSDLYQGIKGERSTWQTRGQEEFRQHQLPPAEEISSVKSFDQNFFPSSLESHCSWSIDITWWNARFATL